jgi:hypothetical protein
MWDSNPRKEELNVPSYPGEEKDIAEIKKIDESLGKDYKCYIGWLWFDFITNIIWAINLILTIVGVGTKTYSFWVSVPTTAVILVGLAYGISAFNSKNGARQYYFQILLKVMIVVYFINALILLGLNSVLIVSRFFTIIVSFILLAYSKNLETLFRKRRQILEKMDRASVGGRYV